MPNIYFYLWKYQNLSIWCKFTVKQRVNHVQEKFVVFISPTYAVWNFQYSTYGKLKDLEIYVNFERVFPYFLDVPEHNISIKRFRKIHSGAKLCRRSMFIGHWEWSLDVDRTALDSTPPINNGQGLRGIFRQENPGLEWGSKWIQ